MKVVILGAGVIGVTTAYALARRGCVVTVIDRRTELASEASFANGGQLSYDFASPMASPGVLRHLADYLFGKDEAFKITLSLDPAFLNWSARFLINCLPGRSCRNAKRLARLAHDSRESLHQMISSADVEFDYRKAGKLVLFDNAGDYAAAVRQAAHAQQNGGKLNPVSLSECLDIEPVLADWRGASIIGGLYAPNDEIGDARAFTNAIGVHARDKFGVQFVMQKTVSTILTRRGAVCGVASGDEVIEANAIVVCTGVDAPWLLRPLGILAPVQPIRGYSLTAPAKTGAPRVAITDLGRKMVYSRIGENLRVAGFADLGTHPEDFIRRRIGALVRRAQESLPGAADFSKVSSTWIGVRPSTPNSLPIVGESKIRGLFLNVGHGMFGWTLSAVCAENIANKLFPGGTVTSAIHKAA